MTAALLLYTTTQKTLTVIFKNTLRGGHYFEPSRLMPVINRDGHFLLTEAVI